VNKSNQIRIWGTLYELVEEVLVSDHTVDLNHVIEAIAEALVDVECVYEEENG